jgi:hypothetical protein
MAGNPSIKKREKERKRQEKQRNKAVKREQRKQDKINGVVPEESTGEEMLADPESALPEGS